ncbi:MAG: flavin reductase family protein [Henriciella sp.]
MFYEPGNGHNLPHNPFNAIITPRPIGWISTRSANGSDNLAPYSFFNGVAYEPPQVMFASTAGKPDRVEGKDSVCNALETGVFCVNIVEYRIRDAMNVTAQHFTKETDEFERAGLEKAPCRTIPCSRVPDAPATLECRVTESIKLSGQSNLVVFGEVVGVHLRDDCLIDGKFDVTRYQPLARMGYRDYARIAEQFALERPD